MENDGKAILVVDDDAKLRELVVRYLTGEGYAVAGVADGKQMDAYLSENTAALIVLDLMLPGEDGLSIARRLRSGTSIPIIILSARGEDIDRIVGLEVGADDYLTKPFNPRELLARIRAVLRRSESTARNAQDDQQGDKYRFGCFTLDLLSRSMMCEGQVVELTPGDFDLLEVFVTHPNRILSRDSLIDQLKGYERSPFDRSVDVRVTRLRKKIEPDAEHPQYIRTVWGKGYMFTPQGNTDAK